jgi:nucleotide-binding universal stress UspA family protein
MAEVKKILFPLEFASITPAVVPLVESYAEQFGAVVHVLHVVPYGSFLGVPYASEIFKAQDEAGLIRKADQAMGEFINEHFKKPGELITKSVTGDPAKEVVKYADAEGIDLIVMGTHGKHGLDRGLYGSVSDMVLRYSKVPVLCFNPKPEAF